MTACSGLHDRDDLLDSEGGIGRLLGILGEALALADLVDLDLAAIHITSAIHAVEQCVHVGTISKSGSDVAGAGIIWQENKFH